MNGGDRNTFAVFHERKLGLAVVGEKIGVPGEPVRVAPAFGVGGQLLFLGRRVAVSHLTVTTSGAVRVTSIRATCTPSALKSCTAIGLPAGSAAAGSAFLVGVEDFFCAASSARLAHSSSAITNKYFLAGSGIRRSF